MENKKDIDISREILDQNEQRLNEARAAVKDFTAQSTPIPPPPQPSLPMPNQPMPNLQPQYRSQGMPQIPIGHHSQPAPPPVQPLEIPTLRVLEALHMNLERFNYIPNVYPTELRLAALREIEQLRSYQQSINNIPKDTISTALSQVMPFFSKGER